MPQTPVEKKFCSLSTSEWRQNLAQLLDKNPGVAEFQHLNQILFVLRDTIPAGGKDAVSGKDAVRRGGSDA